MTGTGRLWSGDGHTVAYAPHDLAESTTRGLSKVTFFYVARSIVVTRKLAETKSTGVIRSIKIAPPNSLEALSDVTGGEPPASMDGSLIVSTPSCIVVGCLMDADGETEFIMGPAQEVDPGEQPTFDGRLETPGRKAVLRTVWGDTILEMPVRSDQTHIQIWANDPSEPDKVIVGIS